MSCVHVLPCETCRLLLRCAPVKHPRWFISSRSSLGSRHLSSVNSDINADTPPSEMFRISSRHPHVIHFAVQAPLEDFLWKIQTIGGMTRRVTVPLRSYKSVHVFSAGSFMHSSVQHSIVCVCVCVYKGAWGLMENPS